MKIIFNLNKLIKHLIEYFFILRYILKLICLFFCLLYRVNDMQNIKK